MKTGRVDLSLAQLQAFVHIVAAGSFRGAALQMGVSQPALSRAIRQAEGVLGTRVFDRDTRNLQFTAVGQQLLPIAERVLREFDASFGEFLNGERLHRSEPRYETVPHFLEDVPSREQACPQHRLFERGQKHDSSVVR